MNRSMSAMSPYAKQLGGAAGSSAASWTCPAPSAEPPRDGLMYSGSPSRAMIRSITAAAEVVEGLPGQRHRQRRAHPGRRDQGLVRQADGQGPGRGGRGEHAACRAPGGLPPQPRGAAVMLDLIIAGSGCRCTQAVPGRFALGAGQVHDAAELPGRRCWLRRIGSFIERFITGTEVTVGVIDLGAGRQAWRSSPSLADSLACSPETRLPIRIAQPLPQLPVACRTSKCRRGRCATTTERSVVSSISAMQRRICASAVSPP